MKVGIGCSNERDAFSSGKKVAETAAAGGGIGRPDFMLAFCSGRLDHNEFFSGLQSVVGVDTPIIGGSAIGVITNEYLSYEGHPAVAMAVESDALNFRVASAGNLDRDERLAGRRLAESLSEDEEDGLLFILYDSIKTPGTSDSPPVMNSSTPLIEGIEEALSSDVLVIGAGVVGDYDLGPTMQFCGSHVGCQNVVGMMLAGDFKPYFRIMHGCTPLDGIYHTISRAEGPVIYELDDRPIVEVIDELYGNREWRKQHPVKLLTIGINYGDRYKPPRENCYVNRLITGALPDGEGVNIFEEDLKEGTEIQFMLRDTEKMIESAKQNSIELMEEIMADKKEALFGIYIDCAGRAASYSNITTEEASEVQRVFNQYNIPLLGFYSGVEVAPLLGKSRGLDWTGVLLAITKEQ